MSRQVLRTRNFVSDAAGFIFELARQALAERDKFRIALSGGNTPRPVYAELAQMAADFPWDKAFITFGDERCVPPEDEQSNYRMARENLLIPAHIPDQSVLRMRGEIEPQSAAEEYEQKLDLLAKERDERIYRHDLLLLGLGDDGHTASLFPGTAALEETTRRVAANFVPKVNSWRLTFTYPLINAARQVCFLVNASKHAELVERVLQGDQELPASRVQPISGNLTWILGQAA
jgi:6-phosphogluconolactonase